jgi:adenylate cyclase, class 2
LGGRPGGEWMASPKEIEIKFAIEDADRLTRALKSAGFRLVTPATHEMNTLYDLRSGALRKQGALLRLRKYGESWLLTHKAKSADGKHKVRIEIQTEVADGAKMEAILLALGYQPSFRYEKYRAEWSDGKGHVVVDETPIGNFGEIEGPGRWIDATAKRLGIVPDSYLTDTYAGLFFGWKRRTRSAAGEMTFRAVGRSRKKTATKKTVTRKTGSKPGAGPEGA